MLQKPKGTRDFLPDEMECRRDLESRFREIARRWGYREVATPAFEELELFTQRSGQGIIQEMYVFEDKGGRKLALRPEVTAPVLRMYVNEARVVPKPLRWYYFADCFRYENPQKGRYRQFWQFGLELIGVDSASADAEGMILAHEILTAGEIAFELHAGHLGFMKAILSPLGPDDQRRAMMLLDKKDHAGLESFLTGMGRADLHDALTSLAECRDPAEADEIAGKIPEYPRIEDTLRLLDENQVPYRFNPAIARGLDYYTGIVFEAFAENLGAENQVLGGGAYRLAHLFGGDDVPSLGFAVGFDRVMVARGDRSPSLTPVVAVLSPPDVRGYALRVAHKFRIAGIRTEITLADQALSAQLSKAAKTATYAAIVGRREAESGSVTMKYLATGVQSTCMIDEAVAMVRLHDTRG